MSNLNKAKQGVCATRDKIINAGESLFSKFSYAAVTMDDISDMLKTTKAALYYHFKSKEELFIEISNGAFKEFSNILDEILIKDIPIEKKFKEFLIAYVDFSLKKKDLARLMMQKFSKKDKKIIKLLQEFKQKIISQIEPLVKEILVFKRQDKKADCGLITLFLIGALNALIASEMMTRMDNWRTEQAAEQITSLIFTNSK